MRTLSGVCSWGAAGSEAEQPEKVWRPHGGGGYFNFRQNSHIYQMEKGRVHSGLTRVVWELNPVRSGEQDGYWAQRSLH